MPFEEWAESVGEMDLSTLTMMIATLEQQYDAAGDRLAEAGRKLAFAKGLKLDMEESKRG